MTDGYGFLVYLYLLIYPNASKYSLKWIEKKQTYHYPEIRHYHGAALFLLQLFSTKIIFSIFRLFRDLHCSWISNNELLRAERFIWVSCGTSSVHSPPLNAGFCAHAHWYEHTSTSATPLSRFSVPTKTYLFYICKVNS